MLCCVQCAVLLRGSSSLPLCCSSSHVTTSIHLSAVPPIRLTYNLVVRVSRACFLPLPVVAISAACAPLARLRMRGVQRMSGGSGWTRWRCVDATAAHERWSRARLPSAVSPSPLRGSAHRRLLLSTVPAEGGRCRRTRATSTCSPRSPFPSYHLLVPPLCLCCALLRCRCEASQRARLSLAGGDGLRARRRVGRIIALAPTHATAHSTRRNALQRRLMLAHTQPQPPPHQPLGSHSSPAHGQVRLCHATVLLAHNRLLPCVACSPRTRLPCTPPPSSPYAKVARQRHFMQHSTSRSAAR